MYIDTHAHILPEEYTEEEIGALVARAKEIGMAAIVNNGLNPETNRQVLALSKEYPLLKASLGLYPIDIIEKNIDLDSEFSFIEEHRDEIVAIGEVGMDLKYSDDVRTQSANFERCMRLAEKLKKPLIIHSRKAEKEVVELLSTTTNKKILMHTFTGNFKLAKKIEDAGWYFSIPTTIWYAQQFQELAKRISLSQIFTETDAPLLGPVKGEKNAPANVTYSIKKIAELKGMEAEEVKRAVYMNYQKVFL